MRLSSTTKWICAPRTRKACIAPWPQSPFLRTLAAGRLLAPSAGAFNELFADNQLSLPGRDDPRSLHSVRFGVPLAARTCDCIPAEFPGQPMTVHLRAVAEQTGYPSVAVADSLPDSGLGPSGGPGPVESPYDRHRGNQRSRRAHCGRCRKNSLVPASFDGPRGAVWLKAESLQPIGASNSAARPTRSFSSLLINLTRRHHLLQRQPRAGAWPMRPAKSARKPSSSCPRMLRHQARRHPRLGRRERSMLASPSSERLAKA